MRATPAILLACLVVAVPSALGQASTGVPVGTEPVDDVSVNETTYPVFDGDGEEVGSNAWRVVQGTGNCCESYLATAPDGRLFDFGGTYLHVSGDAGRTWERVQTPVPYVGGEGAVSAAPGGDVVGVGWAPYTGDQLWAHKYEADEDQWYYAPIPVHTPFHDRPWIAVVPGPVQAPAGEAPYAVLLDGYPTHQAITASLDGLRYDRVTNQHAAIAGDGAVNVTADPALDWAQAHRRAEVAALGAGRALGPAFHGCGDGQRAVMGDDLTWRCRTTEAPERGLVTDSKGRMHHVQAEAGEGTLTYAVSEDDGATWRSLDVDLPGELVLYEDHAFDVAARGDLDQAAVAVHARNGSEGPHQNLVLRLDTQGATPELLEVDLVGVGGAEVGSSVLAEGPRLDFVSVAMLPDGRVAASFKDVDHLDEAAVAVETSALPSDPSGNGTAGDGEPGVTPKPPNPRFTLETTGWQVHADGTASWDPDGQVVGYAWDFGDGATGTGPHANHTYEQAGAYNVTLTVEDDDGHAATAQRRVQLDEEPLDPATDEEDETQAVPGGGLAAVLAAALIAARRRELG